MLRKTYHNLRYISRNRSATFFQYRDAINPNINELKKQLRELIIQLVFQNKVDYFYFTGESKIDIVAHEVVTEIKRYVPSIKRVYVSTRKWNDTHCAWDRTKLNKFFEQTVRVDYVDRIADTYLKINYKLQLMEWCTYIVYYAKLDRLDTFEHLNFKLYHKDVAFKRIIQKCPRKLIKLIDFELDNALRFKQHYHIIPKKKLDLKTRIKIERKKKNVLFKTMIVPKENIRLVERYPQRKLEPVTKKKFLRVRKNITVTQEDIDKERAKIKQKQDIINKKFDKQISKYNEIRDQVQLDKERYLKIARERIKERQELKENDLKNRYLKQIENKQSCREDMLASKKEYLQKLFEEKNKKEMLIRQKFKKQIKMYRKQKSDE